MPVRKRGGRWQADVQLGGPDNRHRASFDSEAAGIAWEADVRAAHANGRPIPAPGGGSERTSGQQVLTLKEASDRCFKDVWSRNRSGHGDTVAKYLQHIQDFFGSDRALSSIDIEAITEWNHSLTDKGQAQSTINSKMSVLSRLLKWGYERGYIPRMLRVPRRKCDNERESFFSEEDEQNQLRLMDQFGYRPEKDLIILLYDTGMRSGEAFKYRGEWYDEETGAIRIPKEINKTKLTRTIWATKRVKEILGRRKKMFGDGLMFPDTSQIRLSTIWGRIRETLGQADNPDYVPYTCRHTCASRMVQRGVRIEVLSRWLGHTNIKMTMRYAKFAPKDFQDAMSVLEAAE